MFSQFYPKKLFQVKRFRAVDLQDKDLTILTSNIENHSKEKLISRNFKFQNFPNLKTSKFKIEIFKNKSLDSRKILRSQKTGFTSVHVKESLLYSPDNIVILGDFNGGNTFLDQTFSNYSPIKPYELALHDEISSSNLEQLINEPTHYMETHNIANLRDLIIISNALMVENSGLLPPFSKIDHIPIFVSLKLKPPSASKQTIQFWDYRQTDIDKLTRLLMDIDWDRLLDCDMDKATENVTDALLTAAKASIPFKTFTTKCNKKPWFNLELKRQIRRRDRLFKIAKRLDTPQDWQRWKTQRNLTTETNRRLKNIDIQSEVKKLLDHKQNPRMYIP